MPDQNPEASRDKSVIKDLGEIPSPYLSGVFDLESARSVELVMARGCNNGCSYCAINESPLRYFSYSRIEKELAYILARAHKLESILVTVADMYDNDRLAAGVLKLFRKAAEKRALRVRFYVNVGSLHKKKLLKLSDCRYFDIEVGIQSIKSGVLRLCHRISDPERIKKNIGLLKSLAPSANKTLGLIGYLPGDDEEGYRDSLEWAISTGLEVGVNHLRVIPGTELHHICTRLGFMVSSEYPYFVTRTDVLSAGKVATISQFTGKVFFTLRVLSFSTPLRSDFFKTAANLPVSRPHLFLAKTLADWWSKRPSTAGIFDGYIENIRKSGSLDHDPRTGYFSEHDVTLLRAEYKILKDALLSRRLIRLRSADRAKYAISVGSKGCSGVVSATTNNP